MLGVNSNLCSLSLVLPWLPLPAVMTRISVSEVHTRQPFLRSDPLLPLGFRGCQRLHVP